MEQRECNILRKLERKKERKKESTAPHHELLARWNGEILIENQDTPNS
jgi:hypothetical protein